MAGRTILTALPPALAAAAFCSVRFIFAGFVAEMADCKLSALNNNVLNTKRRKPARQLAGLLLRQNTILAAVTRAPSFPSALWEGYEEGKVERGSKQ